MSLKTFHTLFIFFVIVFDLGYLAFMQFYASPELQEKAAGTGIFSGFFALALIIYLPFHLKKSRQFAD